MFAEPAREADCVPASSKNCFLMVWARDFVLAKALEIPEYFVYFGVFKVNCQGKRSAQTAKGQFFEVPSVFRIGSHHPPTLCSAPTDA